MRKNTQRTSQAFKVAYFADIQRIRWSATLTAFCHSWAFIVLRLLIPSAITVLQFLAALNRAGQTGYIGTAVAYNLLAPQIALATGRKCSVRTLERALAFLRKVGLVHLSWWTIPDQIVRHDNHDVRVKGTARVPIGDGTWRCLQIRIVTMTPWATALWDKTTCKRGRDVVRQFLQNPTAAKLAANLQDDLIDKSIKIKSVSFDAVSVKDSPRAMFDYEQRVPEASIQSALEHDEERSTRPDSARTPSQTLEHQPVKPLKPEQHATARNEQSFEKSLPLQADSDTVTPSSQLPLVAGAESNIPGTPQKTTEPDAGDCPKGISHEKPKLPRNPREKSTWAGGRAIILNELAASLAKFSRRQADGIYERARYELSREYPAGWPTSVDWPYWVARFGGFSPAQRRAHIARDILPILKSKVPVTPAEPRRFLTGQLSTVSSIAHELEPFLRRLMDKFCGGD